MMKVRSLFFKFIDKYFFTKNLWKIFNRYTIKLSYYCLDNVNQQIKKHN